MMGTADEKVCGEVDLCNIASGQCGTERDSSLDPKKDMLLLQMFSSVAYFGRDFIC